MTDELKKADEIVRALRTNDLWPQVVLDGKEVDANRAGADLIDSLTSQLAEATQIALDVTSKYETSIKMHKITADLLTASQHKEKAAEETLTAIFEHIDRDEYLRKEFCIHPGREDCPSEAANGYVDVDDCCGCPLFVNSYSAPQKAEKGETE